MLKLFKPTKYTLLALLVLIVGMFVLPLISGYLYSYYVVTTHTPAQLAQMFRQRPSLLTVLMYFIGDPLLYFLWLYILGCIVVSIAKKQKNSSK